MGAEGAEADPLDRPPPSGKHWFGTNTFNGKQGRLKGFNSWPSHGIEQPHLMASLNEFVLKGLEGQPYGPLALLRASPRGELNPGSHVLIHLLKRPGSFRRAQRLENLYAVL